MHIHAHAKGILLQQKKRHAEYLFPSIQLLSYYPKETLHAAQTGPFVLVIRRSQAKDEVYELEELWHVWMRLSQLCWGRIDQHSELDSVEFHRGRTCEIFACLESAKQMTLGAEVAGLKINCLELLCTLRNRKQLQKSERTKLISLWFGNTFSRHTTRTSRLRECKAWVAQFSACLCFLKEIRVLLEFQVELN